MPVLTRSQSKRLDAFLFRPTLDYAIREALTTYERERIESQLQGRNRIIILLSKNQVKKAAKSIRRSFAKDNLKEHQVTRIGCKDLGICMGHEENKHGYIISLQTGAGCMHCYNSAERSVSRLGYDLPVNDDGERYASFEREWKDKNNHSQTLDVRFKKDFVYGTSRVCNSATIRFYIFLASDGVVVDMKTCACCKSREVCAHQPQACLNIIRMYYFICAVRKMAMRKEKERIANTLKKQKTKKTILGEANVDPILDLAAEYAIDFRC